MGACMRMYAIVVFFVPDGRGYACEYVHAYVCECSVGCVHAYVCECSVFYFRWQGICLWVLACVCM